MKEYIIVKDAENSKPVGRREVKSKVSVENVAAFIVNGTIVVGYSDFYHMQELAKDLSDLEE